MGEEKNKEQKKKETKHWRMKDCVHYPPEECPWNPQGEDIPYCDWCQDYVSKNWFKKEKCKGMGKRLTEMRERQITSKRQGVIVDGQ